MRTPDTIKEAARKLRQQMTPAERIFWEKVKAKRFWGLKFQRQFPLYLFTENDWLERYIIPDFICFEKKLIIEIDWTIHDTEEIYQLDREKEKLVKNMWFKILRFTNTEVLENIEAVLTKTKIQIQ